MANGLIEQITPAQYEQKAAPSLLKLDLGCGTNKQPGFLGVDSIAFPGVDVVCNLVKRLHAYPCVVPCQVCFGDVHKAEIPKMSISAEHGGNGDWVCVECCGTGYVVPPDRKTYAKWPWADCSVAEAYTSHFLEHLTSWERVHFVNELYRVLVPGGKCTLIVPHWASCRAYGDPSHQWPPVSEFWFYYLKREWRLGGEKLCQQCNGSGRFNSVNLHGGGVVDLAMPCTSCNGTGKLMVGANAPHTDAQHVPGGFSCDFDATWGFGIHPYWQTRSQDAQQFAFQFYKEAITDIVATLVKPLR